MTDVTCQALAERITRKREQDGLLDTRYLISPNDESTMEAACADVEALYVAVDAGDVCSLDFGDLRWRDAA